jgi:hypothetical protein
MTIGMIQGVRDTVDVSGEIGGATVATRTTSPLPDPIASLLASGDPGAELAALAVQSGEQQEKTDQAARDVEQRIEVDADQQQVDALRQKAADIRTAGIWEGVGMVAEGGASVAGACFDCRRLGDAVGQSGKILHGGATVLGALFHGSEATDDANAAAAKSAADLAKGAADDLHDAKKGASDFISAAIDFYREYTSAQASASSAALHRA